MEKQERVGCGYKHYGPTEPPCGVFKAQNPEPQEAISYTRSQVHFTGTRLEARFLSQLP